MFVFNRSVIAVLAPLALLLAVALWSNVERVPATQGQATTSPASQERVANMQPARKNAG
jgi:hypothetical protein